MSSHGQRILIAEDEPRIVSFLEKGLKRHGYEIVSVDQGDRAIELILTNGFDLLLLDLGLPVKDGWAVLEELRNSERLIPVIIITAQDGVNDRLTQNSMNVSGYIVKPFRFSALLKSIEECLTSRE